MRLISSSAVAVAVVGCASAPVGSSTYEVQVTGTTVAGTQDPAWQSETATAVQTFSGQSPIVTTTFNDETGNVPTYIQYPLGSRVVQPGASLMGYSVSTNGAGSFTYNAATKLRPPNVGQQNGWDVIWGDPSITHSPYDQHFVYIANVAVSHQSMPQGGIVGDMTQVDGACIARSNDAGQTFQQVAAGDCFTNGHHRYDGSAMAADEWGVIFAAFNDITAHTIDVYSAPSPTAGFSRMAQQPFAGLQMESHPRMRNDYSTNRLYVLALGQPNQTADDSGRTYGTLYMDYWNGTAWHGAVTISPLVLWEPTIARGLVKGQPGNLRTAAQYSFDVGTASINGGDDIRVVFTSDRPNPGGGVLNTVVCDRDLHCSPPIPEWSTINYAGEQYNPSVIAQPGWPGVVTPVWKVSYNSTEYAPGNTGTTVGFMHTTLLVESNGAHYPWTRTPLVTSAPICPSLGGYWGDYDDLQILSVDGSGVTTFIRTRTDLDIDACNSRDTYISLPMHVTGHTCQ